jgi:polysaccharide biosynthesis protein PslG
MRHLRVLIGGLLAAFALTASTAAASPWFGVNDTSVIAGQASPAQAAGLVADLGADSARVTLDWAWVQPTDTTPDFSTYDAIYRADLARGIHPLFVLTGAPSWAWGAGVTCAAGATCNYPPGTRYNANWQAIAADVAHRYPELAGIEIWNEPNMAWAWSGTISPARYTQLLQLAYTAIKGADPSMAVIGGALATDLQSTVSSTAWPVQIYLQDMYNDGAKGYMNGLSIHPYPGDIDWWYTYKAISMTTEVRDANGDSVPLWITETGMSTEGFSAAEQAEVDANLIRPLLSYPGVAGVYLNTLVEPTIDGQGFGLLGPTLAPTSTFCAVAGAFDTSYTCPESLIPVAAGATQDARWQAENLLQYAANAAIAWYATHGSYTGLTSAGLNAIDSRLSATPAPGSVTPGPSADPSQIWVYPLTATSLMLCNTSQADRSYCIAATHLGSWIYGMATGTVYAAAGAVIHAESNTW